jgi:hypothetical protein
MGFIIDHPSKLKPKSVTKKKIYDPNENKYLKGKVRNKDERKEGS